MAPKCGIDVHQLQYNTVDPTGAATTASGALMIPPGSDPLCQGPRPIVLYAHGTAAQRSLNLANISNADNLEGLFAATVFSSAGPCFLELIGSPVQERYVGLFPTSLASQRVMNYLAETYTTGRLGIGTGISAMPSLHVGFAFLYMLVATKPIWRIVAFAYSMVIFLGSVHLGWHYAVDGIAAAAGTWLIYWMTSIAKHKRSATVPPIGVADLDNGLKA